jgi:hypothetical protein
VWAFISIFLAEDFGIIIFLLVIAIWAILIMINFSKWRLKKFYDSNKQINEEKFFTITEKQIHIMTQSGSNTLTKEKIYKTGFSKNSIYIFTSRNSGYSIEKRYLRDDAKFDALKEFMKKYFQA